MDSKEMAVQKKEEAGRPRKMAILAVPKGAKRVPIGIAA